MEVVMHVAIIASDGGMARVPAKLARYLRSVSAHPEWPTTQGDVAGDWNRAGQAHSGEAKGPNVGGRSAPFFSGHMLVWRL
jgi:hypothetical protein